MAIASGMLNSSPYFLLLFNFEDQVAARIKATGENHPRCFVLVGDTQAAHFAGRVVAIDNPDPANAAPTTPAPNMDVVNPAFLHRNQNLFILTAVKFRATNNTDPMHLSQGANPPFQLWQQPSPQKTDLQLQNDPRAFRVK